MLFVVILWQDYIFWVVRVFFMLAWLHPCHCSTSSDSLADILLAKDSVKMCFVRAPSFEVVYWTQTCEWNIASMWLDVVGCCWIPCWCEEMRCIPLCEHNCFAHCNHLSYFYMNRTYFTPLEIVSKDFLLWFTCRKHWSLHRIGTKDKK